MYLVNMCLLSMDIVKKRKMEMMILLTHKDVYYIYEFIYCCYFR